ncbi:type II secretion system F family protein [Reinekea marinisedimentorum]|uniref:MSHA biogenesis protein MshG n=1 Tax=Reinekea marinisedimentorum TaxID=230495 RepID=A0A4R3I9U5_9GAMM|nr:type II secretion system F family protein [Reinekea marinisedimentorum]TCS43188.1 MSHA biogenesis protein MshG [Reinekea marinisedimentorum]
MAEFFYRGRNESGQPVEGTLQGNSKSNVIQQLKRQNIVATFVDSAEGKHSRGLKTSGTDIDLKSLFKKKKVSLDELIMFSRQMYALTRAGIPLIRAINGLADASRSPLLGEILRDISRSLTQGTTLSNAFRVHIDTFGELFIAMIRMGETTGRLDSAFAQLIDHLELEKDTRKKIVAATRYPIIVCVFIFIALFIINLFVIPQFSSLFSKLGADLPLPTIILIGTSNFMQKFWLPILIAVGIAIYAFLRWKKTPEGHLQWDRFILKIPILGAVFERVALGRFARPFAMMLEAGIPLMQALTVTSRTVGNEHIGQGVEGMIHGIERGESLLATASASGMFNSLILQMIAVGEESGNVSGLLTDIADFYEQEVEYDLKRMAELIEPFLLIFMGIMVLILALGVFLPMWELGSAYTS